LKVSANPELLDANAFFSSVNASLSDAAANTFRDPLSFPVVVDVDGVDGDEPDDLLLLPHAAATSAKKPMNNAA
jgi:hypothetical protein